MTQRRTINDLAREAQVSVSTIDRILNGRSPVKQNTVEHVLAAAERIGFYAVGTIRDRLNTAIPERTFGFLLNGRKRWFYSQMADILQHHTTRSSAIKGQAVFRYLENLDPEIAASELLELGKQCDAVACVCVDHPLINYAVTQLDNDGIPVVPIISNLSSTDYSVFLGSNDWQLGRTAGWFMNKLRSQPGKVAVLTGSDHYVCQQAHEASFRMFIRSNAPKLEMLGTELTGETDEQANRTITEILKRHPDLVGIFVAAGGLEGVAEALAPLGKDRPVLIGTEYSDRTRSLLIQNNLDVLLAHPGFEIAEQAVRTMIDLTTRKTTQRQVQKIFPFRIFVSENC